MRMPAVNSILSRFKRRRRDDPDVGAMTYRGQRVNYWEGKTQFPPTGAVVEVLVDGSSDDRFEERHEFFERLVEEWPCASSPGAARKSRRSAGLETAPYTRSVTVRRRAQGAGLKARAI
jgi:hypothetical protein